MSQTAGIAEWWVFFRQTCMPTSDKPSVARRGRRASREWRVPKSEESGSPRKSASQPHGFVSDSGTAVLDQPLLSIRFKESAIQRAISSATRGGGTNPEATWVAPSSRQAGYFRVRLGIEHEHPHVGSPEEHLLKGYQAARRMPAQIDQNHGARRTHAGRPPGPAPTESRTIGSADRAAGAAVAGPSFPAARAGSPRHASRV